MSGVFLGLIAETSIHVGIGSSDGVIDLPIAREKTTHYPFVPGSGAKGALRDDAERKKLPDTQKIFGASDADIGAGQILVGDLRLLLLPVRCSNDSYKWLTCPHLIERFTRDMVRIIGKQGTSFLFNFPEPKDDELPIVLTNETGNIYLEERLFQRGELPRGLADYLAVAIPDESARGRLQKQLAVVSNRDFSWFAKYAVPLYARNVLRDENAIKAAEEKGDEMPAPTKTSSNLWYEESLAPDTVMTLILGNRGHDKAAEIVEEQYKDNPYLQVGGNETIGQGWFRLGQIKKETE